MRSGRLLRDQIKAPLLDMRRNIRADLFSIRQEPQKPDKPTKTIEFSPDGKRFLICAKGRGQLWNAETGEQLRMDVAHFDDTETWWPFVSVGPIVWSPAGHTFLTFRDQEDVFDLKSLCLWDAASGRLLHNLECEEQPNFTLFSPSGDYLLRMTFLAYPELAVHHLSSMQTKRLPLSSGVGPHVHLSEISASHLQSLFAFSPDGRHLLAPVSPTGSRVFDLASGEPVSSILHHDAVPLTQSFTPDGSKVVICSGSWENEDGMLMTNMSSHERVNVHDLDGRLVGSLASYYGDAEGRKPDSVTFSTDGRAVVPWLGGRVLVDLTSLDLGVDLSFFDYLSEQEDRKRGAIGGVMHGLEITSTGKQTSVRSFPMRRHVGAHRAVVAETEWFPSLRMAGGFYTSTMGFFASMKLLVGGSCVLFTHIPSLMPCYFGPGTRIVLLRHRRRVSRNFGISRNTCCGGITAR